MVVPVLGTLTVSYPAAVSEEKMFVFTLLHKRVIFSSTFIYEPI